MKIDFLDSISNGGNFGGNKVFYGLDPASSDLQDGVLWFEPGALFPQPWIWNNAEQIWLSSPVVFNWNYNVFTINSQGGHSWINESLPFYSNINNRIYLKSMFGNLYNVGTVAHDATLYFTFFLERYLGTGLMASTVTLNTDTQGLALPNYTNQASPEVIPQRPASTSQKRITMLNQNIWLSGNSWYQRLRATRSGGSTAASGVSVGLSLFQVLQFGRL